jgi:hypothetical protein
MADLAALRTSVHSSDAALAHALYQNIVAPNATTAATLANARQTARTNRNALNAALAAALPAGADPATGLRGDLPIVLFPLRLETRFLRTDTASSGGGRVTPVTGAPPGAATVAVTTGGATTTTASDIAISALPVGTLQIRVYPDEILAETHEPELTDAEWQAGRAYWTAGDSLASWAALLARFPAPRAAWIVNQTSTTTRPPARAASWTRPATAVLPDQFAAFAYRGDTLVGSTIGAPVVEPLTLTLAPTIDAAQRVNLPGSSQQIDQDLLWTVDFAAAKAAGMGLELTLSALDWMQGFDLLLVIGAKGSFSIAEASQQIQALLDGHHYTRGLALVPPGTPTSNSATGPSGYPPVDPGGARSFAVERGTPASGDGLFLANALGVNAAAVAHLDQTGLSEDAAAQAMMTALWPATLGYHLEQMMAPTDATVPAPFDANAIAAAYEYTRASVRAGGPLPAIRVGAVPYSVLPATSLTRLATATPGPLATALAALRPSLLEASDKAPRVNPGSSDPDTDLVNVLRLNASSTAFQVQVLIGSQFQLLIGKLRGANSAETKFALERQARQAATAIALLRSANLPATNAPRIALASFGVPDTFAGVLVSSQADRQAPLPDSANYIKWIMGELSSGAAALTSDSLPAAYERTLLYQLLRHAVLVEKSRTAQPGIREVEVVGLVETAPTAASAPTTATREIDTTVVATLGSSTASSTPPPPPVSHLADVTAALGLLAGLPVADLERLLTETLDLCSHRFDAWITSLATARLKQLRGAPGTAPASAQGSHYGAYGWVQNLKPQAAPFDPGQGGFIHAPSPNHAQAAAILRNGFLARGGGETNLYAIDLSSARMRAGLALLARVRDGESLSEILGTEIETRLRANVALATTFLEALRASYPMPSSPIVDGLAAVLAWRSSPTSPHFPSTILSDVSQLLDAAADLLTAESVFQMVRGNPAGAAAGLDALGQGARPPEPQIAHAPVAGNAVSHRVAVVLDDTAPPGWTAAPTPRASVNRYLDGWLGQLLGDPQRVKCQVKTSSGTQIVTLGKLGLRPIDVVVLSEAPLDGTAEIEARIRAQTTDPAATISYAADPSWGHDAITFPALLEFARALDKLISLAHPFAASDLALPAEAVPDPPDPDLTARAQAAMAALAALDLSTPATQLPQLREAAFFGFAGAYVADNASAADLAAAAQRVDAERQIRLHEVQATTNPSEIVRSVFARSFPLLGRFSVPAAVAPALAGPAGLSADDVERWVHKAARVRPGLERWRRSRLFAQALGAPAVVWEVVQLPFVPTANWCGLAFAGGAVPASGTLSVVLHRPWKTAPSAGWAGLLFEEWSELIPSGVQQTGIAFNYPSPRAEAPQVVLVAVPPANAAAWSTSVLADVVRETFDLVRLRLLTPDLLTSYSLLLPATALSVNTGTDTLSTNLWIAVIEPIQVVAAGG